MKLTRTLAGIALSAIFSVGIALASIEALGSAAGGIGTGGAGFLPAGHFIGAKQSMIQIFPRPDTETASYAREHWAFYNGTNDIPYDVAVGVAFGAYPYVFTLLSGPPGMTIEQPTYTTFQNVGYGRVLWHPQGNITQQCNDSNSCSYTVEVEVTDQQRNTITLSWKLQTDDDSTTYEAARHFVFVSATGSGSTCTYAAPCLPSAAFGSTFAATTFPGAVAYAFAGTYSGSANLPAYTDNDIYGSGTPVFEPENAKKPAALIGIPGQTATFDASANNYFLSTNINAADWYMENITANGYDASGIHPRLIDMEGGGGANTTFRQTYDQITWTNSGYGSGTNGNESMFYSGASSTSSQYLFITDSTESSRESGAVGNNYGFCDIYSETNGLIQRGTENSPSANLDAVFYLKSDDQDIDLRENFANVSGASHGFDIGQSGPVITENDEIDYNIGINVDGIYMPDTSGFTWGDIWVFRNSLISTHGLTSNDPNNASGYFEFDSNAVQTSTTPQPIAGSAIHSDGLNQSAASGLLNTSTGDLTGTYANPPSGGGILGTVGAQISATP